MTIKKTIAMKNLIKEFECDQCRKFFPMVIKKCFVENTGFMCRYCWKMYYRRLAQIMWRKL
jgi:hypothetical protein